MASTNSIEAKVLQRGGLYLTPLLPSHIQPLLESLSDENKYELELMGYDDPAKAFKQMQQADVEAYVVKDKEGKILVVGGLWHSEEGPLPQMFAMFTKGALTRYITLVRGSHMLLEFFSRSNPAICMCIMSEFEGMLNWAAHLGFQPMDVTTNANGKDYVEFLHCNFDQDRVYHKASRPVVH